MYYAARNAASPFGWFYGDLACLAQEPLRQTSWAGNAVDRKLLATGSGGFKPFEFNMRGNLKRHKLIADVYDSQFPFVLITDPYIFAGRKRCNKLNVYDICLHHWASVSVGTCLNWLF